MPELLVELGCEELPAAFVRRAFNDLELGIADRLSAAGIAFERGEGPMGTPRRLIVHFRDVAERQPDRTEERRGPSLEAAFDAQGNPTSALLGFCRSAGVEVGEVRKKAGYAWAKRAIAGRSTREVLSEIVPDAVRAMSFDKAMRWGQARMRFARPIRWILASFGGEVVPFEIEGVHAGLRSRGHRFENPEEFEAGTFAELVAELRIRRVEPDPAERETRIREGASLVSAGTPEMPDALVDENVFLTEWPVAIQGEFKPSYLDLPEPVLVTAMAKHEKMFPIRGPDGSLSNRFVFVRNSGQEGAVRSGVEWVLNARFNDAKFFFDEDRKSTFDAFLGKTAGIVFQEKLGTVRQRADRLASLTSEVARLTGADSDEIEMARQAGRYAKADLSTGLVSELASLQGVVGCEYARREAMPEAVCWAIASHYDLAKNPTIDCPGARTAVRLLVADQLDKLVGFLGIGLAPSGSSDPFGLRRAATMLIEAAWAWSQHVPLYAPELIESAASTYAGQGIAIDVWQVSEAMAGVFRSRYDALLPETRPDFLEAAAGSPAFDSLAPREVRLKLSVLGLLASDRAFVQTATRPINIFASAVAKGQFDPASTEERLNSADAEALRAAARAAEVPLTEARSMEDSGKIAETLRTFDAPINRFFDSTMVMDEDPAIRQARLALVGQVSQLLQSGAGDLSKVVLEGE